MTRSASAATRKPSGRSSFSASGTIAIGVLAGSVVAEYVNPKLIRWIAGLGFIVVGAWVLLSGGESA